MRFSYCKALIDKKSFFIYSSEYFFEDQFNSLLLRQYGLSKFFIFFSYMLFEFHNSNLNTQKTFIELGKLRSKNFAKLLLYFFYPHLNIKDYFFLNIVRFFKPILVKGKNLMCGLPMHGQRTHSNRKTIQRFRDYVSNYISSMSLMNLKRYVIKIKYSSKKIKDVREKPKKKTKKEKSKVKPKKKTKKVNV